MRTYRQILQSPSAGDLTDRITIGRMAEHVSPSGYRTGAELEPVRSCRAAVLHNTYTQMVAADAQQVRFDITFVVRNAQGTPVTEGMYIQWHGEQYRIVQADDRRMGPLWLTLRAVKTGKGLSV